MRTPFLLSARRPVHRGTLLRLAQQWRVLVCTPQVLARVRQLETAAERETLIYCLVHFYFQRLPSFVEFHPALVIQAVLVLDLLRDEGEVAALLWSVLHALPLVRLEMVFPGCRTTINRVAVI